MQTNTIKQPVNEIATGGITTPNGFYTGGIHAGLRHSKKDMGMIYSSVPASCAAVYTLNHFQAAPIKVTKNSIMEAGKLQAIIVNSANANACTGARGMQDALEMRSLTAEKLNINQHLVAVASTGVIGEFLPMVKIKSGIEKLTLGKKENDAEAFQTAILTTDTVMKKCCFTTKIAGKKVTIGGAAKGSGMIHPNMATMLAFLTTDAVISSEDLHSALKEVTNDTFNQITVDGDTSTNDMVIVMANGKADNEPLSPKHPEWDRFVQLLKMSCESLAKQIARDGEGATKLIEVNVKGAFSDDEANKIAKQIVGSNLVKTAVHGADANWGRIICAIGQTATQIDVEKVDINIGPIPMLKNSEPQPFSEIETTDYLNKDTIHIYVDLNIGNGIGKAWGCDLSYDYVKINANYRT